MGRKRRDCPVFGCGSKNLVRLANHLDQTHNMDSQERLKWLRWAKIGLCLPQENDTAQRRTEENSLQRTLAGLIERQEKMETNFNNYLRTVKQPVKGIKRIPKQKDHSNEMYTEKNPESLSKRWLRFS